MPIWISKGTSWIQKTEENVSQLSVTAIPPQVSADQELCDGVSHGGIGAPKSEWTETNKIGIGGKGWLETTPLKQFNWELKDLTTNMIIDSGTVPTVTLKESGYVNCVPSDIGKQVKDDGVNIGVLNGYDNTTRTWQVATDSPIANDSVMTIANGTGTGTSNNFSIILHKIIPPTQSYGDHTLQLKIWKDGWTGTLHVEMEIENYYT